MNTDRPVNLALTKFSFPLAAIASITHRITGVALFLGTAVLLYLAELALASPAGFERAAGWLAAPLGKLVLWAVMAAGIYHFVAGIRHLLLDLHIGESNAGGKLSAQITFALSAALIVLAGIWLW